MKTMRLFLPIVLIALYFRNVNAGFFRRGHDLNLDTYECIDRFGLLHKFLQNGMRNAASKEHRSESLNEQNQYSATYNTVLDSIEKGDDALRLNLPDWLTIEWCRKALPCIAKFGPLFEGLDMEDVRNWLNLPPAERVDTLMKEAVAEEQYLNSHPEELAPHEIEYSIFNVIRTACFSGFYEDACAQMFSQTRQKWVTCCKMDLGAYFHGLYGMCATTVLLSLPNPVRVVEDGFDQGLLGVIDVNEVWGFSSDQESSTNPSSILVSSSPTTSTTDQLAAQFADSPMTASPFTSPTSTSTTQDLSTSTTGTSSTQDTSPTTTSMSTTQDLSTSTAGTSNYQDTSPTTTSMSTTREPATSTASTSNYQDPSPTTTSMSTTHEPATSTTSTSNYQDPSQTTTSMSTTHEPTTSTAGTSNTQDPSQTTTSASTVREGSYSTTKGSLTFASTGQNGQAVSLSSTIPPHTSTSITSTAQIDASSTINAASASTFTSMSSPEFPTSTSATGHSSTSSSGNRRSRRLRRRAHRARRRSRMYRSRQPLKDRRKKKGPNEEWEQYDVDEEEDDSMDLNVESSRDETGRSRHGILALMEVLRRVHETDPDTLRRQLRSQTASPEQRNTRHRRAVRSTTTESAPIVYDMSFLVHGTSRNSLPQESTDACTPDRIRHMCFAFCCDSVYKFSNFCNGRETVMWEQACRLQGYEIYRQVLAQALAVSSLPEGRGRNLDVATIGDVQQILPLS